MRNILKLWIEDKIHLTIWSLWLSLLILTWFLLPKIQVFLNIAEKQGLTMVQVLISSIVLNIALLASFIRFLYQNKFYQKKGLVFSQTNGCWHTKDKKQYFCPKCLNNNKRSPLKFTNPEDVLNCTVCGESFTGPSYRSIFVA